MSYTVAAQSNSPLFRLLSPNQTGVQFANQLFENDTLNILNQANIYNGSGVGAGDFNKDGLMDLYFAGNMVGNRLYLNKDDLKFDDITNAAGVDGQGRWCTGVSVVDINADGWPDIYVAASFASNPLQRTNLLYIHQGLNAEGKPVFKEMAAAYGLADDGFSTQGYFFDYDKDGDLDLYLVTNEIYDKKTPIRFRKKLVDGSAANTDRLYRNNGNNTFTNVSKQAGITIEGWGHAACITDINRDGWPDIYVANDFVSNDLCYINNKDGTFTNQLDRYFKHSGWNAMGTDAVDLNNDGYVDLVSLEMLPEDNLRKKRMLSGNEYYNYTNAALHGYQHQYVRNVLQLNSGITPSAKPVFSDIGFMAGVYQTDWSWCPLVADFDNDGLRDLIITNGLPRDVTDLDYIGYNSGQGGGKLKLTLAMTDSLPIVKLPNYAFKNVDGLSFSNTTKAWGFDTLTFSNGAAYADLDNDGDLDVIISNINGNAFIYENTFAGNAPLGQHYLAVQLGGPEKNPGAIGVNIHLFYGEGKQLFYEHQPMRGYLSTHDARAHFGLGNHAMIDSIIVSWPDGNRQVLQNVTADQQLNISYKNASKASPFLQQKSSLFHNAAARYGIQYKPVERDFVDYNIQRTLPHKLSQYGPSLAVGDIDNNGFDDLYVGGTSGNRGVFFMQNASGRFTLDSMRFTQKEDPLYEDMGVLLFDADNDGDLDLYIVSGSYEIPPNHAISNNRLFINNGKGMFTKSSSALPADLTNGSCVKAADFDGDGDLDLFVGGRVVSGAYGVTPRSFIFRNDGGRFTDVTTSVCPKVQYAGMVTDALWTDFDNDGKVDLVVTGEWMPVAFYKNNGKTLEPVNTGIEQYTGWWNSLAAGDFDHDGDIDYVAGNLGLNSNYKATPDEPMWLMAKDIDNNGSIDPMVFCYLKAEDGSRKIFPMCTRDDLVSQVITMRKKFPTYKSYGQATMSDFFAVNEPKDGTATEMRSAYIENMGNGTFTMRPLPAEAQMAPVYGMQAVDANGDGHLDLLLVGNDYGMDPYSGRHDAFSGLMLQGNGGGQFKAVALPASGFEVPGDAKALVTLHTANQQDILLASQNQDSLVVLAAADLAGKSKKRWIKLQPGDYTAEVVYANGKKKKVEFYYGCGFLSQSTRQWPVDENAASITITNFKGVKRKVL